MRTDILEQAKAIRASMDAAAIVLTDEQAAKAPRAADTRRVRTIEGRLVPAGGIAAEKPGNQDAELVRHKCLGPVPAGCNFG